jgi:orotidine-5'-phosphate decarboxylase
MPVNIIDILIKEIDRKKSALVVGLDPNLEYFPKYFKKSSLMEISKSIYRFNRIVIDAVCNDAVAIKPQLAYYEVFGSYGIKALEETIIYARKKNLIIINDAKRGDIGATSKAYAEAMLGCSKISADFVTVNPYLGSDAYMPFVEKAAESGKGIFILLKTSNQSSVEIQNLKLKSGKELYIKLAEDLKKICESYSGSSGYSYIGCVVGASYPKEAKHIREILKKNFFLVPGFGFQGANVNALNDFFDEHGYGALISSSRGITYPYLNTNFQSLKEAEIYDLICKAVVKSKKEINKIRKKVY